MPATGVSAYLNFNGNASAAIALYQQALGAQITFIQRFGDTPEMSAPEEVADRVCTRRCRSAAAR